MKRILLLLILLSLSACATVEQKKINSTPEKVSAEPVAYRKTQIWIQPFLNTKLYFNGKPTPYKLVSRDKAMGLVELNLPIYPKTDRVLLELENSQYGKQSFTLRYSADLPNTIFEMHSQDSEFSFVASYPTGIQPKSVRFLDNERVVLPLLADKGIDIINIRTGERKRIAPPGNIKNKTGFVESLIVPKHKQLWISQMQSNSVHVFHLDTLEFIKTIPLSGIFAKVMLYDAKRDRVYVSNWLSENISFVDPVALKEISITQKVGLPRGMLLSKDNKYLYIAQFAASTKQSGGGRVAIYDLEKNKIVKLLGRSGAKRHIVPAPSTENSERVYVSDMCCLVVELYDMTTKKVLATTRTYHKPNTIAMAPDGTQLYISTRGQNNPTKGYLHKGLDLGRIYVMDTKTNEVIDYWEAGNQPTGLDISPNGKYLVTSDFLDYRIRVYERRFRKKQEVSFHYR